MDFSDALKALKEGKKVRYKEMQNNFYLYIQKTDSYKGLIQSIWIYRDKYPTLKWEPDEQELLLDTWEIVDEAIDVEIYTKKFVKCPNCNEEVELGNTANIFCNFCGQEIKPKSSTKDKFIVTYPDLSKLNTPDEAKKLAKALIGDIETIPGITHGEITIKVPNLYINTIKF